MRVRLRKKVVSRPCFSRSLWDLLWLFSAGAAQCFFFSECKARRAPSPATYACPFPTKHGAIDSTWCSTARKQGGLPTAVCIQNTTTEILTVRYPCGPWHPFSSLRRARRTRRSTFRAARTSTTPPRSSSTGASASSWSREGPAARWRCQGQGHPLVAAVGKVPEKLRGRAAVALRENGSRNACRWR